MQASVRRPNSCSKVWALWSTVATTARESPSSELTAVHRSTSVWGSSPTCKTALNGEMPEGSLGHRPHQVGDPRRSSDTNAHPHTDCEGDVVVVHNGIVENYRELKRELVDSGHVFESQTDSECIPHLIEAGISRGLLAWKKP